MHKNALILIMLIITKPAYCIGYSGLNADLELFYLGVILLLLVLLFSIKAIKWIKLKVTKKNEIVD